MQEMTGSHLILGRRTLLGFGLSAATVTVRPAIASSARIASNAAGLIRLRNGHRVWTRRVGTGGTKILLLHGGPGFSHDYLECFADLLPRDDYQIYFYDQLGCGKSDRPDDPSLWTLPRYLEEVEEVRAALGLDRFVMYGHSWGALLGIEYALRHGKRLSGLILSNMTASIADLLSYLAKLRAALPETVRRELERLEASGATGSEAYGALIQRELYSRHVLRLQPWPEPVTRTFSLANTAIYNQMQGANEFVVTGNLLGWDRWSDLGSIESPTLVMGAVHDEMNPQSIVREARLIPGARLFMSKTGSHLAMWDDQANYFHAMRVFLSQLR